MNVSLDDDAVAGNVDAGVEAREPFQGFGTHPGDDGRYGQFGTGLFGFFGVFFG
jgi:hypothetical protein